jgi:hypothetical protein
MDLAVISSLVTALASKPALDAIQKAVSAALARKQIQLTSTDKDSLAAELASHADAARGSESVEDSSKSTREVIVRSLSILEKERDRLTPIATREHWIALVFAVVSGSIFLGAIVLGAFGSIKQAFVSLAASAIPGFLSAVFFSRESKMEGRIKEITGDIWESEKAKERLELLEEALKVVPAESKGKLADAFSKKLP